MDEAIALVVLVLGLAIGQRILVLGMGLFVVWAVLYTLGLVG